MNHTIRFGYYGRREETWRALDGTSRGSISFANFASFAGTCAACNGAAQITNSSIRTGTTLGHWYRYPHAFYVQDDIKVKPNLTLNIGLRYELPSVLTEKHNQGTNFIPGIGPVLLGTNLVLGIDPSKNRAGLTYVYARTHHALLRRWRAPRLYRRRPDRRIRLHATPRHGLLR